MVYNEIAPAPANLIPCTLKLTPGTRGRLKPKAPRNPGRLSRRLPDGLGDYGVAVGMRLGWNRPFLQCWAIYLAVATVGALLTVLYYG